MLAKGTPSMPPSLAFTSLRLSKALVHLILLRKFFERPYAGTYLKISSVFKEKLHIGKEFGLVF